jgi:hypothetical protein
MSVRLHIDSGQQLFIVHADGEVTTEEIDAVLDALQGSAVAGYRKPFDATLATTRMDAQELLAIGVGMKALQDRPLGPLAFVLQKRRTAGLARVLGILATADRPLRLFEDAVVARRWLDGWASPPGPATTRDSGTHVRWERVGLMGMVQIIGVRSVDLDVLRPEALTRGKLGHRDGRSLAAAVSVIGDDAGRLVKDDMLLGCHRGRSLNEGCRRQVAHR